VSAPRRLLLLVVSSTRGVEHGENVSLVQTGASAAPTSMMANEEASNSFLVHNLARLSVLAL
jgi:hypothetical protein